MHDTPNTPLSIVSPPLEPWLQHLTQQQQTIEAWFKQQFSFYPPPLYTSVDLRFSGYKLAPVDTNLFPAGFNNISQTDYPLAIRTIKKALAERKLPKNWLLVPENHTRNLRYWENIHTLQYLFTEAGCRVQIGSLLPDLHAKKTLNFPFGELELHPLNEVEPNLIACDCSATAILLNNDLAEGIPAVFKSTSRAIYPPPQTGWHQRRKSHHASIYQTVAQEFALLLQIDPWLISTYEALLEQINFDNQETLQALKNYTIDLLEQTSAEYTKHHVQRAPFLMMKANAGTYGQAVMSIRSADVFSNLNRKQKQEMQFTKGKQPVDAVLLQEGVYTTERVNEGTAEPVIYLINGEPVGAFYRINTQQTDHDNLNKPGMTFQPISLSDAMKDEKSDEAARYYAYGVIARLATLAAAKEMEELIIWQKD